MKNNKYDKQQFIKHQTIDLICYGCGDSFELSKFKTPKNRDHAKPIGGLWTSPVDSEYGWAQWCEENDFGDLETSFKLTFTGRIYVIDSVAAVRCLPWRKVDMHLKHLCWLNYEAMHGIDAIHLTVEGERVTRDVFPYLFGWDCESVFILNPSGILSGGDL